jgi:DNA invertase Pin-like site-specific DNA recombinase
VAASSLSQGNSRVAIYARVSTNHGQDVTLQTRELRQFAAARGWTVAAEFRDTGICGAKDSRPELNRLMILRHGSSLRLKNLSRTSARGRTHYAERGFLQK